MCGISGIVFKNRQRLPIEEIGDKMNKALYHRGPDDNGIWTNQNEGILLNHTRLSINDLTTAGKQPMVSYNSRYVLTFNGEIYNFKELRKELEVLNEFIPWKGNSDTEVLLELINYLGIKKTLMKLKGMFAFALYDQREKKLFLVRDRYGEKPLYWGLTGEENSKVIIFASDLKAIKAYPEFNNEVSRESLRLFLNYGYVPDSLSIYEGIYKLMPGHLIEINLSSAINQKINPYKWWDIKRSVQMGLSETIENELEAINLVEEALHNSVNLQAIADVKVASFLSGGIDSTLISTIYQRLSLNKISTFTIGFENRKYNEAPFAEKISNFIGSDHSLITFTNKDALQIIPKFNEYYSEPFADPASIPTLLMCKSANLNGIKVALSGDGADELFGGYNRYTMAPKIWGQFDKIPTFLKPILLKSIDKIPHIALDKIGSFLEIRQFRDRVVKLSERLSCSQSLEDLYYRLLREWNDVSVLVNDEDYLANKVLSEISINSNLNEIALDPVTRMMIIDCLSYLPGNNQVKLDRGAMAFGVETRSPFLDVDLGELIWKIPIDMKVKNNSGKYILKKILNKYMPEEIFNRPKAGFATPISEWIRGPLKDWSQDMLNADNIKQEGYLNESLISNMLNLHIKGEKDYSKKLWPIIIWQSWINMK